MNRTLYEVDPSQWTPQEWMRVGLPYCRQCMTGPWDAHFVAPGTGWGYEGQEPCPHGHIVNQERMLEWLDWHTKRSLIIAGFFFLAAVFAGTVPLLLWALVIIGIFDLMALAHARTKGHQVFDRLGQGTYAKLDGFWVKNKHANQPWIRRTI
jgi:hypothetical protein